MDIDESTSTEIESPPRRAREVMQFNQERLELGAVLPLATPLVIYVEPSSFCNLECTFCPQHISPDKLNKSNMPFSTFKKLTDDISRFPERPKLMRFCGLGDSLVNKDFLRMVEYVDQANAVEKLELITNGLLLTDKLISKLPLHLDRIIISLEGLSTEDYIKYTKRKIDLDKFINKLRKLGAVSGKSQIHIKIHSASVRSQEKKEYFYDTFGAFCDEIFIENLVDLWPQVTSNLGVNAGHRFDGGDINKVKVCPQIFKSMQVNSDGRVIPCCIDWAGINIIGDIKNEGLEQIWRGSTLKSLRNIHLQGNRFDINPCKGCTMNEYTEKDNIDDVASIIYKKLNRVVTN